MKARHTSFFYLKESHVEDYRKSIINYLKENEEAFKRAGEPQVIIELYDLDRTINLNPNGNISLYYIEDNSNKIENVCKYILSSERKFLPVAVSCEDKKNYGMIEKILKDNYGDKGKLTNGFLRLGALFNQKTIKGR